jgi:dTDP-4-dehydrorhamnose reductase
VRLLITGAAGQVGRALCDLATEQGIATRGLTKSDLDVTNRAAVERAIGDATIVVNAAAYTAVDRAEGERDAAFTVNRDGAACLASACAVHGVPLLHISTDYVFDGRKTTPYREDDPIAPLQVYGASKAAGEEAIRTGIAQHIILRTAWVFSPHGQNFVLAIRKAAAQRTSLDVVDDQRGGPTAAGDIAIALLVIARRVLHPAFDGWGTYHFCGTPPVSRAEFAREILRDRPALTVHSVPSSAYMTAAVRPLNSVLDCTRIAAQFGIAQPSWKVALAEMLRAAPSR